MNKCVACGLTGILMTAASIVATPAAKAAGGAHVVDDSEVETPGLCHAELWVARFVPGDGYGNAAPACTTQKIPWLEIGAAYQHYWDDIIRAPLLGPAMKIAFQPASRGFGVALGLNSGVNLTTGELGFASVTGLATIPLDDKVSINLNAGWSYLAADNPNAFFYGAQVEAKVGWDVTLMIEAFGRAPGLIGNQVGLRYTPNDGRFDFDLLIGTYYDEGSTHFFTMGVTIRF